MRCILSLVLFLALSVSVYASAIQPAPVPKSQFFQDSKPIIETDVNKNFDTAIKPGTVVSAPETDEVVTKQDIITLYNANSVEAAYQLIARIPEKERDAEMWLLLANITQDYGKENDAILLLQKSIETNPKYYKAYYNLGNIYFKQNKIRSASENYILAAKYNKGFSYAYYNLGCCYMKDSMYSKAKSNFIKAIKLKNNEPNFYYNLAFSYNKLKNTKQATKALDFYNSFDK